MSYANFKFPAGTRSAQQKEEIIRETTDMFAGYLGEAVPQHTLAKMKGCAASAG